MNENLYENNAAAKNTRNMLQLNLYPVHETAMSKEDTLPTE